MTTKGKKSAIREEAENIVDAYAHDVLPGDAPGITLADLIEVEMAEAVAAALEFAARHVKRARTKKAAAGVLVATAALVRYEVKP